LEFHGDGAKPVVHINMDESSVKLSPTLKRGHVAVRNGFTRKRFLQQERKNGLKARRAAVTLVAFVSDNKEVNKALPQIIVGSEAVIQAWMVPLLANRQADNIFVLRRKSAWLAASNVAHFVKALGVALDAFMDRFRFILMMDAAPVHIPRRVVQACTRAGLHFLCIPASMTAYMQPLDTHVFALYKNYIRDGIEAAVINSASGEVGTFTTLEILVNGIQQVIQARPWRQAFLQNGFGEHQQNVSASLKQRLGLDGMLDVPADLPTLEELNSIYPRRHEPPVGYLFELFLPARTRARILPLTFRDTAPRVAARNPWAGRLRSSSSLALDDRHWLEEGAAPPVVEQSVAVAPLLVEPCREISQRTASPNPPAVPRGRRLLPMRRRPEAAAASQE